MTGTNATVQNWLTDLFLTILPHNHSTPPENCKDQVLATKHDSLWARIWTRPQENPLSLWGQQLECGGSWLSSLKGHEIRSQKTWIWGQQLVSGLGWKGPCHWSRWWSQHQPLGQDPSPQGPYTWMPATRQTGTKFNEDPSTSAAMGLRVTGPICPGTCCVCWGNLCYLQKTVVDAEDHSVLRRLTNWLGSNWEAQDPGMERGSVLVFSGSASTEMPKRVHLSASENDAEPGSE